VEGSLWLLGFILHSCWVFEEMLVCCWEKEKGEREKEKVVGAEDLM